MTDLLTCWKCGASLADLPTPLRRRDECPDCRADLHVCRMCEFYAASVSKQCREPVAEEVNDKTRANFCDYFRAKPGANAAGGSDASETSRAALDALFSVEAEKGKRPDDAPAPGAKRKAETAAAKDELSRLFGLNDKDGG